MIAVPEDPLGAFCSGPRLCLDGAPGGPLSGLTFTAKDSFDVAGSSHRQRPPGFGSPLTTPRNRPLGSAQRLLGAGASLVGKTQCDELQFSLNGENVHYGTPRNPAAPTRVPGGSSSGTASAVAGGAVDFGLAVDCGGSVRIPASYGGILGLRPAHGRISGQGCAPLAPSLDTVGLVRARRRRIRKRGPRASRGQLRCAPGAPHHRCRGRLCLGWRRRPARA